MAKLFFFGRSAIGHINPSLGLVSELIKRGEEVYYYAEKDFNSLIHNSGASVRKYNYTAAEPVFDSNGNDGLQSLLASAKYLYNLSRHLCKQLLDDVQRDKPDYIIYDSCAYWGRLISRICSLPAVSSITTFVCNKAVIESDPGLFIEGMIGMDNDSYNKKYMNMPVLQLLERLSVPFRNFKVTDDFFIMDIFNAEAQLNIVYTSKEFQPSANILPVNYLFTGPLLSHRNEDAAFSLNNDKTKKLIYISMGTIFDAGFNFYQKIFTAFENSPYQIILSTGNTTPALPDVPSNFIIKDYVPQLAILKEADLFISHGGMNGINESIVHDTPLLLIPKGVDRLFNAKVIEKQKAGIMLDFIKFTPGELRIAAEKILSEPVYRENITSIKNTFAQSSGVSGAVDRIFDLKNKISKY